MSVKRSSRTTKASVPRRAAFYDLDGTLVDINLLHATAYVLANVGEWRGRVTHLAALAARLPILFIAERYDRRLLNVEITSVLKGVSRDRLLVLGEEYCQRVLARHIYPQARDILEGNRAAGLEPILVTGSPDFVAAPIARHLGIQTYVANQLIYSRDLATGRLKEPIMAGEEKSRWCEEVAQRFSMRLADCWGYADSYYDLPFLTTLGHPVVVNPDRRLAATARIRHWPIVQFRHLDSDAASPPMLGEP